MNSQNPQARAASPSAPSLVFTTIACPYSRVILANSVSITSSDGLRDVLAQVAALGHRSPGSVIEVDQATLPVDDFQAKACWRCAAIATHLAGCSDGEVQE